VRALISGCERFISRDKEQVPLCCHEYAYGFDAQSGEFGNQVNKGTVRIALQDGASIAGLLITTEAMVAEKPKKETPMPAMPPGGGMDY
jgi:chaperonin GroEL